MNSLELIIIILIIIFVIFLLYKKNINVNRDKIENFSTDTNIITMTQDGIIFNKKVTFNGNIEISDENFIKNTLDIYPPGIILPFFGTIQNIPRGWVLCDGQSGTPDLRGRFPLGSGKGTGLTERLKEQIGGAETHTLTIAETPAHSHTHTMRMGKFGSSGGKLPIWGDNEGDVWNYDIHMNNVGESRAHNNMPPFVVVHYIMKK
jgi:hypothetical protein